MAPGWVQVEDEAALHTLARSRGAEGVPPSRRKLKIYRISINSYIVFKISFLEQASIRNHIANLYNY